MYDAELIETKKKVDAMLLQKDIKYLQGYEQGRADQKEEDNVFFNFEGAWELEKKKVRADAFEELFFLAKENAYDDGVDYSISLQVLDELIEQLKEQNK